MKDGQLLKRGSGREVRLERRAGEAVVVKRFEHGPRWRLGRGRRRARREYAALLRAYEAGLAVPRPLSLERDADAWAVRMSWIPNAQPLSRLFERDDTPTGGWLPFLEELAALLAGLVRAGIEHPDLHTGNVLVDRAGRPWLVDFHQARSTRTPSSDWLESEVVRWAALTREHLSTRLRRAFLDTAKAALPARQRALIDERTRDLADLEVRARAKRRDLVLTGLGRWLRPSGKVRLEGETLVRSEPDERLSLCPMSFPGDPEGLWRTAARLEEHHIRALRPERLERSKGRVSFRAPADLKRVHETELPRRLGAVLGRLHHRGLDAQSLGADEIRVDDQGHTWVLPTVALTDRGSRALGRHAQPLDAEPAFRRAYRAALVGGRAD